MLDQFYIIWHSIQVNAIQALKLHIYALRDRNFNILLIDDCLYLAETTVTLIAPPNKSSVYLWYLIPRRLKIRCSGVVSNVNITGPSTDP